MRDTIVIFVAFCTWAAAFYRLKTWFRASQQGSHLTLSLKYIWYFNFFLACAVTLFYDKVTVGLDTLTGLNNLSWLGGYLCGIAALYFYGFFIYDTIHIDAKTKSRVIFFMKSILLFSMVTLTLIYLFAIRVSPSWPSRFPRSSEDVLFQNLFFTVATIFSLIIVWATYLFMRQEKNHLFRLQAGLSLLAIVAGMMCFVLKILFVSLWLSRPTLRQAQSDASSVLLSLNQLALLAMASAGALCLLNNAIIPLCAGGIHVTNALFAAPTLSDLFYLQSKLHQHHLIAEPTPFSWREYLAEPDYYILRTIVSVLDTKRRQEIIRSDSSPEKRKLQEAIRDLDHQAEYETLVTACRRISRSLKTHRAPAPRILTLR